MADNTAEMESLEEYLRAVHADPLFSVYLRVYRLLGWLAQLCTYCSSTSKAHSCTPSLSGVRRPPALQ